MKKILLLAGFVLFALVSVAQASDADHFQVGVRYEAGNLLLSSNSTTKQSTTEFAAGSNVELYGEWKPLNSLPWLGVEVSGQLGNNAPKTKDYDLSTSTNEISAPALILKAHAFKNSWVDLSIGAGGQVNQGSGTYEQDTTQSTDNYVFDPISGNLVYTGTTTVNVRNRYPVQAPTMTGLLQIDADFSIWKGLSLGLDAKCTPGKTTVVDLNKRQTSYDGGAWTDNPSSLLGQTSITQVLQLGLTLGYSF